MHEAQAAGSEAGYAMVALLVAIAVMTVFLSIAMPAWRTATQREREAELIWRGQQYDRAVQLFRRKFSAPGPPNLDILIQQKFLRKKYKDPITGDDFELKPVGPGGLATLPPGAPQPRRAEGQLIGGVRSKSKQKSLRVLNGRDRYDQWEFVYVPYNPDPQAPGTTAEPGQLSPGQRRQGRPASARPGTGQTAPSPPRSSPEQR